MALRGAAGDLAREVEWIGTELTRRLIYSHHIIAPSKRAGLRECAQILGVTTLVKIGWPGAICLEGPKDRVDAVNHITRWRWKQLAVRGEQDAETRALPRIFLETSDMSTFAGHLRRWIGRTTRRRAPPPPKKLLELKVVVRLGADLQKRPIFRVEDRAASGTRDQSALSVPWTALATFRNAWARALSRADSRDSRATNDGAFSRALSRRALFFRSCLLKSRLAERAASAGSMASRPCVIFRSLASRFAASRNFSSRARAARRVPSSLDPLSLLLFPDRAFKYEEYVCRVVSKRFAVALASLLTRFSLNKVSWASMSSAAARSRRAFSSACFRLRSS